LCRLDFEEVQMFHHPRLVRSSGLIALLAVMVSWSGSGAATIQGTEGTVRLGPIGVAKTESVRVNVYGIGDPNDVPWDFVVRIFNTRGDIGAEQRVTIAPGVTRSVEVNIGNPDLFPADSLGRRTLRAEIVGFNPQPDPPGFAATLETYNRRSGATGIVLGETFVGDEEHVPGVPR
jgi:hypothetical protein